jgi:nitrogen fixation protein FixH
MSRRLQQFVPGETVRVRVSFTNEADAPIAVAGVAFSVRNPAGTVTASAAVQIDASTYYTDVAASVAGDWAVRATASSPTGSAVEVQFTVTPSLVLT